MGWTNCGRQHPEAGGCKAAPSSWWASSSHIVLPAQFNWAEIAQEHCVLITLLENQTIPSPTTVVCYCQYINARHSDNHADLQVLCSISTSWTSISTLNFPSLDIFLLFLLPQMSSFMSNFWLSCLVIPHLFFSPSTPLFLLLCFPPKLIHCLFWGTSLEISEQLLRQALQHLGYCLCFLTFFFSGIEGGVSVAQSEKVLF